MKSIARQMKTNSLLLAVSVFFSFCVGLVALKIIMPGVIEQLYEGKKLWIINKEAYSLDHYLQKWNRLSTICVFVWALINTAIFIYINPATRVLYSRLSRIKTSYIIVFSWVVLVIVSVIGKEEQGEKFLMSLAFLAIYLFFVNIKAVHTLFVPVNFGKKALLIGVFSIMTYVQITKEWFYLYPFVQFGMFCTPLTSKEVVYYEYEAQTVSDETIPFNPTEVIPALRQRRIEGVLRELEAKTTSANNVEAAKEAIKNYTTTIQAIGKLHNQKRPDQEIVSIHVFKCYFNIDEYTDESSIKRDNVWNIILEPEKIVIETGRLQNDNTDNR